MNKDATNTINRDSTKQEYLELLDRSRKRGFFAHLFIYIVINSFLILLNIATIVSSEAPHTIWEFWVVWSILGWGIGLVAHGYSVFFGNKEEMRMRELEIELGIPSRNNHSRY